MKRSITLLFLLLISANVFAIMNKSPYAPEQFADDTYVIFIHEWMEMVEPEEKFSQHYDYALRDKDGRYEVRYTLFKQTEETEDVADLRMQAAIWSQMVSWNIGGGEEAVKSIVYFNDSDVQAEFNGDYGITATITTETTDFTEEFQIIMANFYVKEGLGIMCQTILFDDMEIFQTEDFFEIFHSFRFY